MKLEKYIVLSGLLFVVPLFAQEQSDASLKANSLSVQNQSPHSPQSEQIKIQEVIQKGLQFLEKEQFAQNQGHYNEGEWPVQMKTYMAPAMVGLGRPLALPSQEATAFATASIMNTLSEIYSHGYGSSSIPAMLRQARPSFSHYREGDIFFYYPMRDFKGLKMHLPRDPHYVPKPMMSLATVPPDADTTSVSFLALANADLILDSKPIQRHSVPDETLQVLETYRDLDRKAHLYNRVHGGYKNTGAYLTWLWDEEAPSNGFWTSMNHHPSRGYRIVFGRNDLDCVVNANVLRLLAVTKRSDQPGYESSCKFLNRVVAEKEGEDSMLKYCGTYYPNTWGALYSISNAFRAGATCLKDSQEKAIAILLEKQQRDGAWKNDKGIGRIDRVQSTASALNALLNFIDSGDRRFDKEIQKGVNFLLSKTKTDQNGSISWKGEVFFSGGPAARNTILWRSESYTTSLALLALTKAQSHLQQGK